MAAISGYDSSSMGYLFSSLNNRNMNSGASLFGGGGMLGINFSDYATIRNGSYRKLLGAYYAKEKENVSNPVKPPVPGSTATSKDDAKTLTNIENAASAMKDSMKPLLTSGKDSVFNKVTTTDKEGVTTTDYNKDAIYKAVSSFVDSYNSMIDKAADSNTKGILRAARNMVNDTKVNSRMLGKMGITIGTDNKLTVDEKAFKAADMNAVKDTFTTRGAYGYRMNTQAALIESYAKSEAAKSNTYGKNGVYTYNYNTGALYNSVV